MADQKSKKYFSFLFDSAVVILDANGSQTTEWMVSETKRRTFWSFPFLGGAFVLFLKMSMVDRFTCLCSARSIRGDASETSEKHAINSHLSNVKKCRCLRLTTVNKAEWKTGEKKKEMNLHTSTQRSAVSARGSSPSILIAAPGRCCRALGMNSHGAAVVMSQMRSALTWAWTHRLEWSCSLSCRRQTIVAADSSTSSLGSEREWLPLTSILTQTLKQRVCAWVKSRILALGWCGKL